MLWAQYDFLHVAINKVLQPGLQLPRSHKTLHESGFIESRILRSNVFLAKNEETTLSNIKDMEKLCMCCLQNSAASPNCTAAMNDCKIMTGAIFQVSNLNIFLPIDPLAEVRPRHLFVEKKPFNGPDL